MSAMKPPIPTLTNPALGHRTRVIMKDGREGTIVDHCHQRRERLMAFVGKPGVHMTSVDDVARAWPAGQEHVCVFDGRSLSPVRSHEKA